MTPEEARARAKSLAIANQPNSGEDHREIAAEALSLLVWCFDRLDRIHAKRTEQAATIEKLESENARLAKMFADDTYIESATLEPGYYDINLRGKGAMLIIGTLAQMFRDSGGVNFHTSTLSFVDNNSGEEFELTIQKVCGDTPAKKIQRLTADIDRLKAALVDERAARSYYEADISYSTWHEFMRYPSSKGLVDVYLDDAKLHLRVKFPDLFKEAWE